MKAFVEMIGIEPMPPELQSGALPTELHFLIVVRHGLEPLPLRSDLQSDCHIQMTLPNQKKSPSCEGDLKYKLSIYIIPNPYRQKTIDKMININLLFS
tara:strand:- start:44919 stop:45212 length:294 start_codon:yes stop_codon:yes gene_type:complete